MPLYAFDGTWNDSSRPENDLDDKTDTNVHRFQLRYKGDRHYIDGVGTRYGVIGKLIGGLTGAGAQRRIDEQFELLKSNFAEGKTEIDIVGYSRGAAISRMFVRRIEESYPDLKLAGEELTAPPEIRFLGLFDTVASFGLPWTENEHDFRSDIPGFVVNTFHAMALDETRETFGIERCGGNPNQITEVWFRGGHGDIGGNATFLTKAGDTSNRKRSDLPLRWMLKKAEACGLPLKSDFAELNDEKSHAKAPVTAKDESIGIGSAGTLSRRIHLGDLVHHSVEKTYLTKGIDGRLLRRIGVSTRIEDKDLENRATPIPMIRAQILNQELPHDGDQQGPSLIELSTQRYPFELPPARTWKSWLEKWEIENPGIHKNQLSVFWAPTKADRALAWDVYVELRTRITTQGLKYDEGDEEAALHSVYSLFPFSRQAMQRHGIDSANTASLITAFLNEKIRRFTAKWHKRSLAESWNKTPPKDAMEFRGELHSIQHLLTKLAEALSDLSGAKL